MTHLQAMMVEATQFRMLRDVYRRDPSIGPASAEIMRDIFQAGESRDGRGANRPQTLTKINAPY